ncbi:hypothetical protein B0T13DRAFT_62284 [Neurospora crassa]|nr:hypothetical protein B0T13DRAFT_62284 [Neurospora crassa]
MKKVILRSVLSSFIRASALHLLQVDPVPQNRSPKGRTAPNKKNTTTYNALLKALSIISLAFRNSSSTRASRCRDRIKVSAPLSISGSGLGINGTGSKTRRRGPMFTPTHVHYPTAL